MYIPLSAFLFLLGMNHLVVATRKCYFPDGSIAKGDVPCNDSLDVVGCCGSTDVCYDKGLCSNKSKGTSTARGSCTDPEWGSDCPTACLGIQLFFTSLCKNWLIIRIQVLRTRDKIFRCVPWISIVAGRTVARTKSSMCTGSLEDTQKTIQP